MFIIPVAGLAKAAIAVTVSRRGRGVRPYTNCEVNHSYA